jgi:hypothetical protein
VQQLVRDPFRATRTDLQGVTAHKSEASISPFTSHFLDRSSSGKCPRTASQAENAGSIPVARSPQTSLVSVVSCVGAIQSATAETTVVPHTCHSVPLGKARDVDCGIHASHS